MRQSRFEPTLGDETIRLTERDIAVLKTFDHYRLLPFNWLHALIGGPYVGLRSRCTKLVAAGYLKRKTFNGTRNIYETMTYYLTEKGTRTLLEMGHPQPDPYDRTHDNHQVLLDILDASIELGAKQSATELIKWDGIKQRKPDIADKPFKFQLGKTWLIPDGRPFVLKNNNGAILFLKELDRNTESAATIKNKIANYHKAEQDIKDRYGVKAVMLLWVTTTDIRKENILKWIGSSKWMLTQTIFDHTPLGKFHPVSTKHFHEPYERAGYKPFSLEKLEAI